MGPYMDNSSSSSNSDEEAQPVVPEVEKEVQPVVSEVSKECKRVASCIASVILTTGKTELEMEELIDLYRKTFEFELKEDYTKTGYKNIMDFNKDPTGKIRVDRVGSKLVFCVVDVPQTSQKLIQTIRQENAEKERQVSEKKKGAFRPKPPSVYVAPQFSQVPQSKSSWANLPQATQKRDPSSSDDSDFDNQSLNSTVYRQKTAVLNSNVTLVERPSLSEFKKVVAQGQPTKFEAHREIIEPKKVVEQDPPKQAPAQREIIEPVRSISLKGAAFQCGPPASSCKSVGKRPSSGELTRTGALDILLSIFNDDADIEIAKLRDIFEEMIGYRLGLAKSEQIFGFKPKNFRHALASYDRFQFRTVKGVTIVSLDDDFLPTDDEM